jgi:hypothetical protein
VTDREVLAFDLYGTLVDPIAISSELGEADGAEAARLAMGRYEDFRWVTSRALDFALASLGTRLPDVQAPVTPDRSHFGRCAVGVPRRLASLVTLGSVTSPGPWCQATGGRSRRIFLSVVTSFSSSYRL